MEDLVYVLEIYSPTTKVDAIILQENLTCLNAETNFPRDKVTHID